MVYIIFIVRCSLSNSLSRLSAIAPAGEIEYQSYKFRAAKREATIYLVIRRVSHV